MRPLFLLILFWATALTAVADGVKTREVRGRVLGLDGRPAAGRHVRLVGLSRGSAREVQSQDWDGSNWDFITDAEGRFRVRFWEQHTWDSKLIDKAREPGWGMYALYADAAEGDAGAVYAYVFHPDEKRNWERPPDEWGVPVILPADGLDIVMQIVEGIPIEGTVYDYEQPAKVLERVTIQIYHNLHSDSHTGHGGEIFYRRVRTDAQGHFRFEHVYPHPWYPEIGDMFGLEKSGLFWLRTKINHGDWQDEVPYVVPATTEDQKLKFDAQVTMKPLFRFFGKVTDPQGAPVAGADVVFHKSLHSAEEAFEDGRQGEGTKTLADGSYEILLGTPWVLGVNAAAKGLDAYRSYNRYRKEDRPILPGELNLQLQPAKDQ